MALKIKSIPKNTGFLERQLRAIIEALTHNQEVRFMKESNDKVVTRQDLLDLGIIDTDDLEKLN